MSKAALRILAAVYGVREDKAKDVTKVVSKAATKTGLVLKVSNATLGGDPYPNHRKRLWVTYELGPAKSKATSIEGTTIRLGA